MTTHKNSIWPKRLLVVTLVAVFMFFSVRVYYRLTDDFRLSHIKHEMPYNKNWEVIPSPEQKRFLQTLFQQSFYYLGKGAQSYAFASDDGQYVLKFFKFKHLKPNVFVDNLPEIGPLGRYKNKSIAKKKRQIQGVFDGYKLAYEKHRSESGILFIQLNPSLDLNITATFFDKIGRKHQIELDSYVFIVQKYANTTRELMDEALKQGDVEKAKDYVRQIIALYLSEYQKGIYDRDHGVLHNTGFAQGKPIHLDVGKLSDAPHMKEQKNWEPDLKLVVKKYHFWLKDAHPNHYNAVISTIEEELSQVFGKPYQISG